MPLPKSKLKTYQKYFGIKFTSIREFDDGTGHPVVLMSEARTDEKLAGGSWMTLMCPCDLTWKWQWMGKPPHRKFYMVHTLDEHECVSKEYSRAIVRDEARAKYRSVWETMSLADCALDVWKKSRAGEYFGERNVGTLYVEDIEQILGTTPNVQSVGYIELGGSHNADGEVVDTPKVMNISFPSKTILAAMHELKKRKLVDLNGMILTEYKESFRFPDQLHHFFARIIEEPLGWPNGEAGDCFMFQLYSNLSHEMKWSCCEDIFGSANTPKFIPYFYDCFTGWLFRLNALMMSPTASPDERSAALIAISIKEWVTWLEWLREDIQRRTNEAS